jgi:PilZ domain
MGSSTQTDALATTYAIVRRYRRITLPKGMLVAWYGGDDQRVSRVKTLGMGGLFVAEPNAPAVGTNLRLSFEVPGGSVHVEAIVRNVTPGEGMGLEFTRLNTRDRVLMEILLRRLLRQIPS